jgi:hypothetical protein
LHRSGARSARAQFSQWLRHQVASIHTQLRLSGFMAQRTRLHMPATRMPTGAPID